MYSVNRLKSAIFKIASQSEFEDLSLEVFRLQYKANAVYRKYCDLIGRNLAEIKSFKEIPFLPISFFKHHKIILDNLKIEETFLSSGTGLGGQSKHYVSDIEIYRDSFNKSFMNFYGKPEDYCFLALLPSYLERRGSSLVFMVDEFIKKSKYPNSGFFINNYQSLNEQLAYTAKNNIPTILIGVSFGLLDFSEKMKLLNHPNLIVMETGGMKGRKKELTREELHKEINKAFEVESIHSEYGMTELLSQAYSKGEGRFNTPPWMKVLIRKQDDPFSYVNTSEIGGINVIDLANLNSCAFVQTDDLGKVNKDESFEVIGRFDNSEIRGCNLMVG
jgi:hypothetical protein